MIIATVITCPQRWRLYQRFRRQFDSLGFPFPLRTFQTSACLSNPFANNNLNSRAALAYCQHYLPDDGQSWVLYLEDDVVLGPELPRLLPFLVEAGCRENVDCWFICNRKNPVLKQYRLGPLVVNELAYRPDGGHGLLIPRRHLPCILASHWTEVSDRAIFAAIHHPAIKILQVVQPVLVEHIGEVSTYTPHQTTTLQVNYAN